MQRNRFQVSLGSLTFSVTTGLTTKEKLRRARNKVRRLQGHLRDALVAAPEDGRSAMLQALITSLPSIITALFPKREERAHGASIDDIFKSVGVKFEEVPAPAVPAAAVPPVPPVEKPEDYAGDSDPGEHL